MTEHSGKYTHPNWILALELAAGGIDLHLNADKIEFKWFNKKKNSSTQNWGSLKRVEWFTYLGSNISSTENKINMWLVKAWMDINRLLMT